MFKIDNMGFEKSADKMLEEATKFLEVWQRLVHITWGELKLTKSSYAMMMWKMKEGKEVICNKEGTPGTLKLRSGKYKGLQVELKRNDADTAER